MSEGKDSSDSVKWTAIATIVVALIGAIATMTVGNWQYNAKFSTPTKESPTIPQFRGRIIDAKTSLAIRQVKISLEATGAPAITYSDSEGYFSFPLSQSNSQVRIRVNVDGFEQYDRFITPSSSSGVEEIRINSIERVSESYIPEKIAEPSNLDKPVIARFQEDISEPKVLDYSSVSGTWLVVEKVKPEQGGWEIVWLYDAIVRDDTLEMKGRKTRVDSKEPTSGEKMALSIFNLSLKGLKAEGKFEEENYRGEILRGDIKMIFCN
jgi:hypothetical protein